MIRKAMILALSVLLILCFMPVVPAFAGEINVSPGKSIQEAINTAGPGDTVMVAAGTYNENITLKSGVVLRGAGADVTTIQGTGTQGIGTGSVVTADGVDSSAKIDGFTITGGNSNWEGGGISCNNNSSPIISNNTITGNSARCDGGGISCYNSSPTISNNIITGNSVTETGGGISCGYFSSPTIYKNTITDNSAECQGGGISCSISSPTILKNTITDNSTDFGGGVYCFNNSSPTIANNIITGNSAEVCGGVYCDIFSSPTISNCIIIENSAELRSGGVYCVESFPTIFNCIIWGNGDDLYDCSAIYSCIENGDAGEGNISDDPMFVDKAAGDYHLRAGSPCIDAGTNEGAPDADFEGNPRPCDGDGDGIAVVDMGAYEYVTSITVAFVIGQSSYTLEGVTKNMDVAPYIKDSRTYVPVRYLAYSLGIDAGNIGWDSTTKTVTLTKGADTVTLVIGSKTLDKNGTTTTMDVAPTITDGRTMLPARWVGEAFGATVSWDSVTRTVMIEY